MNFILILYQKLLCRQTLRIMKLSFLLIFLSLLQLSASVFSQNTLVSLDVDKKYTIKELFQTIEDNTSYRFFYNADLTDLNKTVSVKHQNIPVNDLLDLILNETTVSYKMLENNMIVVAPKVILQQGITVTGTVTDNNGPLPGVNVTVKGTSTGVVSDFNGKYSITVPNKDVVLSFSFIGFVTQEITVGDQTNINVTLSESTQEIEEVVVVGYGSQKKINLTGAVATVKGETLENRSVVNMAQALQGTVANLNIAPIASSSADDYTSSGGAPGSKPNINIRGYTGINSDGTTRSQSPLIVIDGIQGGDISTINMNDVESISVLKDAASSAIYGSSAPYGVIIITTKRGRTGQRPTISYNNNFMFSQPINLPKMMNSWDWATAFNEACANANRGPLFQPETMQRIQDYMDGKITDGTIKNPASDAWMSWESANANTDWFDVHFKDVSFSQQHNVGITGGTNNSNYYIGMGYNQQEGMYTYGNDQYQRYNVRTNLSTEITKWLTFSFRGAYSRGMNDTPNTYAGSTGGNYMHQLARKFPTIPLRNPDGNYSNNSDVAMFEDGGRNKTNTDNAILTGEFVVRPLTGWDITANYSFDGTYVNATEHLKTIYHTLPSGALAVKTGNPNSLLRRTDKNQHTIINLFSSYEKQLSGHYFKVLVGFTQELYDNLRTTSSNNYLYSDDIPSLALTYGTTPSATDYASQLAIRGGFGRINYNYQEKYLLEFNGRYDGTSRFLKDVRFKFYPGVSAAWVASKESFWQPLESTVNLFKIRASYGQLGDQAFTSDYYPFYPALRAVRPTSTSPSNNFLFSDGRQAYIAQPASLVNPALTWVTTATIDFGVDLAFFSNQLNISFDWYKRTADDFVGPAETVPSVMGVAAPQTNNASMETKGFELNIGWKDQIGEFSYGINAVLSDYQSTVTMYPNKAGLITTWYEGKKLGEIWGYETIGLFQSDEEISKAVSQSKINANPWTIGDVHYANLDGDDEIYYGDNTLSNPGDRRIIGNSTPRYSFGVNLNAAYKGFDFSMFFQGVGKRNSPANHTGGITSYANMFWGIPSGGSEWQASMLSIHHDRWRPDNPGGYFPKQYMSSQNGKNMQEQTRYLQNAAYMRIKNLQIGYTLPAELMQKIYFQKLRIFVNVENLATITKMIETMDPEFTTSDGKIYPLQRVWAFGLNVTF